MTKLPFTAEKFKSLYDQVMRLTVEILLIKDGEVLLTKRAIKPYIGIWHIPGGTVYRGEPLKDAVARIAKREIGIDVLDCKPISIVEYPELLADDEGACVGVVFLISNYEGELKINHEASEFGWFKQLPENTLKDQATYLNEEVLTANID